jgi:hypothetical protein
MQSIEGIEKDMKLGVVQDPKLGVYWKRQFVGLFHSNRPSEVQLVQDHGHFEGARLIVEVTDAFLTQTCKQDLAGSLVRFAAFDFFQARMNATVEIARQDLIRFFQSAPKAQLSDLNEYLSDSLSHWGRLIVDVLFTCQKNSY